MTDHTRDRRGAERRVGLAKLWARAKQIVTTDPTGSDDDDRVVDDEAARVLAASAGRLKGGLAKVAQLAAYDPGAALGGRPGASERARAALGALWDQAPAVSAAAIGRVVEEDLGAPPEVAFARWDRAPLAAASLGQVHAAALADGTEVVVKVQYPGIAEALRADLDDDGFVRRLAGAGIGRSVDEPAVRALADAVRGELDYRAEADALGRFAAAWAGHPVLRFPRVIAERSSARVLTMTRARGDSVAAVAARGAGAGHAEADELRRAAALAIFAFAWGSPRAVPTMLRSLRRRDQILRRIGEKRGKNLERLHHTISMGVLALRGEPNRLTSLSPPEHPFPNVKPQEPRMS